MNEDKKEYFDILDENGNKTGKIKLRSEVHRDGDWHKAVHIWIMNNKREVLLQRRSATVDSSPNMIDLSCGGHLSAGEDSISAAKRELKEELGLNVESDELKYIETVKSTYNPNPTHMNNEFSDIYILKINKTIDELIFQKEEVAEIFYVPYKEFKNMVVNRHPELKRHDEDFEVLFRLWDN